MTVSRKIGVLTFHRCINYGSYWQARCLVEGLRACGHEVELLDHDCRWVSRAELRCSLQPLLPERTPRSDLPLYKAKGRKFLDALNKLPLSEKFSLYDPSVVQGYDIILVGSDEVWNLRHPWYGGKPIFFGSGLNARRLVSYAASFGNHDAGEGLDPYWAGELDRFALISVRDENSLRLVQDAVGREAEVVLDPCLQFPETAKPVPDRSAKPYALVYGHSFPAWLQQAAQQWSRRTGIPLLSIGYRNRWADEQLISAGPSDFAAMVAGASAVITNFFHGCIFALLNGKPFVGALSAYRFNKVRDLLAAVGAQRHLVDEGTSDLAYRELLSAPLERRVSHIIGELRARSNAFLDAALA